MLIGIHVAQYNTIRRINCNQRLENRKNVNLKINSVCLGIYTHRIIPNLKIGVPPNLQTKGKLECIAEMLYIFLWVRGDFK
jgi:hypothetical protein